MGDPGESRHYGERAILQFPYGKMFCPVAPPHQLRRHAADRAILAAAELLLLC
jgi:hypothetical protein